MRTRGSGSAKSDGPCNSDIADMLPIDAFGVRCRESFIKHAGRGIRYSWVGAITPVLPMANNQVSHRAGIFHSKDLVNF
jgi:hypothetical protein